MRLVGDDDDVVARAVRILRRHWLIEFLNQREDVTLVRLGEHRLQLRAAPRPTRVFVVVDDAAARKCRINLPIEIIAVGEDQKREVPADLAVHLPGEECDRIGLPRPLRVPEHAELAVADLALSYRVDRAIDAEELLVLGDDLDQWLAAVVEQDEVLEEVEEVRLGADALEQRLHIDNAGLLFGKPLPFAEVLVLAGERSDLCRRPVAENNHPVVLEHVRDRVLVVGEVPFIRAPQIAMNVLQLHEEERQAVDEADNVRPSTVERPLIQSSRTQRKWFASGFSKSKTRNRASFQRSLFIPVRHEHAVAHEVVFLAIGMQQRLRDGRLA